MSTSIFSENKYFKNENIFRHLKFEIIENKSQKIACMHV